tara:strand:- start:732 stop:1082 length:351 start_codon:yes stop_codon:yes gene_type:complete
MPTKYINKLAAGNGFASYTRTFVGLTSQGSTSPNVTLEQYGANPTNVSLAARSVQIYAKVGGLFTSHGPVPFIASGATGAVKMSMMYGYDLSTLISGYEAISSGAIYMGSNGASAD